MPQQFRPTHQDPFPRTSEAFLAVADKPAAATAKFDGSQPDGKRDILEGRLIALALQALQLGTNVVLDFGL